MRMVFTIYQTDKGEKLLLIDKLSDEGPAISFMSIQEKDWGDLVDTILGEGLPEQ